MNQTQKEYINTELGKLNKARELLKELEDHITTDYLNGINWLEKYAYKINKINEELK